MPSLFAASITVLPAGTCTARPSISRLTSGAVMGWRSPRPRLLPLRRAGGGSNSRVGEARWYAYACGSDVWRHDALLVLDVMLELAAEVLDETLDRQRRGVAERTDRAPLDVVGNRVEHVEVLATPGAMLDAVDHPPQPSGALAARRALPAGFLEVEVREAQQALHHAARIVDHDHRAGTQHRSRLRDGVVVHREAHHQIAREDRRRRAAGNHRLQPAPAAHTTGHCEERRERRPEL